MSNVNVILLEKVEKLGAIGDVVSVKPGFARNFLLPQKKALRATKDNIAYFEKEKAAIEKVNADKRSAAEKEAKKLDGLTVVIIRQASEGGQLYGSITARDIAEAVSEKSGLTVKRGQVDLNQNFKTIGLFETRLMLHPEVIVPVQLNIARSEDEAKIQSETGQALVAASDETLEQAAEAAMTEEQEARAEAMAEELLDDEALEAKKAEEAAEAEAAAKAEAEAEVAAKAEAEAAQQEESTEESSEETKED